MRRIFFTVLLTAAVSSAICAKDLVAEGKSNSVLGDYRIEMADNPVMINGESYTAFVINYQNTPMEVQVIVKKDRGVKKFYVLSDKLCVQYVCNQNYFGVELLDKSMAKDGYSTSELYLDKGEYFHQKVITSGQGSELENTRLVASYFPLLLKGRGEVAMIR
jgi:hypothetical protein